MILVGLPLTLIGTPILYVVARPWLDAQRRPPGGADRRGAGNSRVMRAANSMLSMPAIEQDARLRVLRSPSSTGRSWSAHALTIERDGASWRGDAFVTGWGISLPNAPVDNAHIEAVLGHIEAQSAAVKRRVLINNGIADPPLRHRPGDRRGHPHQRAADRRGDPQPLPECRYSTPTDIACLACGSSSADQVIPSHASMVHAELGTPPCEIISPTGVCCAGVQRPQIRRPQRRRGASAQCRRHRVGARLAEPPRLAFRAADQAQCQRRRRPPDAALLERVPALDAVGRRRRAARRAEAARRTGPRSASTGSTSSPTRASPMSACISACRRARTARSSSWRTVDDEARLWRGGYLSLSQDVRVLNDRLPALMKLSFARMRERRGIEPDEHRLAAAALLLELVPPAPL